MLNPDKQTVADLKALPKTTIAAVHGVSSGRLELALGFDYLWAAAGTKSRRLHSLTLEPAFAGPEGPNQLPQDGGQ
jgi:hypothetical protein